MSTNVTRRSARAILLDGDDLLLIKRTRPGQEPYWVSIGGGVEPEDATLEDAVRREVLEEIGADTKNIEVKIDESLIGYFIVSQGIVRDADSALGRSVVLRVEVFCIDAHAAVEGSPAQACDVASPVTITFEAIERDAIRP